MTYQTTLRFTKFFCSKSLANRTFSYPFFDILVIPRLLIPPSFQIIPFSRNRFVLIFVPRYSTLRTRSLMYLIGFSQFLRSFEATTSNLNLLQKQNFWSHCACHSLSYQKTVSITYFGRFLVFWLNFLTVRRIF